MQTPSPTFPQRSGRWAAAPPVPSPAPIAPSPRVVQKLFPVTPATLAAGRSVAVVLTTIALRSGEELLSDSLAPLAGPTTEPGSRPRCLTPLPPPSRLPATAGSTALLAVAPPWDPLRRPDSLHCGWCPARALS
eukprot:EG_transcript_18888